MTLLWCSNSDVITSSPGFKIFFRDEATRFRPFVFLCHDVFGWHEPDDNSINVDEYGFQYSATCKYCGKHIIQDSQGNWF